MLAHTENPRPTEALPDGDAEIKQEPSLVLPVSVEDPSTQRHPKPKPATVSKPTHKIRAISSW